MAIKKTPFTFLEDFSINPMDSGSFLLEQGIHFSRAFTNLDQVVLFLIEQKELYLRGIPLDTEYRCDYENFDRTGLPKKEDDDR